VIRTSAISGEIKMENKGLDQLVILPAFVKISGKNISIQPGNLSKFANHGNGVYGYQKNTFHPIKGDPPQEESGGFVYFGNGLSKNDFKRFLRMMGVSNENRRSDKDYLAFMAKSKNPIEDRYFKQMRLVSKFGLRHMFNALDDEGYENFPEQKLSVEEALWAFIESEKKEYGTFFGDPRIEGKMGGDGDCAREELSFGFMVENSYYNIYRIWSRAWLVTK
jgi:hypothetical protein